MRAEPELAHSVCSHEVKERGGGAVGPSLSSTALS